MTVNPVVRLVAALSNLTRHKIGSAEGVEELTPIQDGALYLILSWCREQDPFQQGTEEELNLLTYAVRILSGLTMLSMMLDMVVMARSSTGRIVDAKALILPEGYDTMLTGDHGSLMKEIRDGGRAGRWQGLFCQTAFRVLTLHGEYRYNFLYWIPLSGNLEKGGDP